MLRFYWAVKRTAPFISWKPVSSKRSMTRFSSSSFNLPVVATYAATLHMEPNIKDTFYDVL